MLILTRYANEDVIITVPPSEKPRTIVVRAVEIDGRRMRLGFTAESEVVINRMEVQEAIDDAANEEEDASDLRW